AGPRRRRARGRRSRRPAAGGDGRRGALERPERGRLPARSRAAVRPRRRRRPVRLRARDLGRPRGLAAHDRRRRVQGLFVTGTDTGVGKTVLSAALVAAMAREGARVGAHKPVLTGLDERDGRRPGAWPADHELLARAAGMAPDEVAPLRYGPAASPHLAAQLAGERIDPAGLLAAVAAAAAACAPPPTARGVPAAPETERRPEVLVIEGVGGLLVPLAEDYAVRDLARALKLPILIAAHPGLGT